MKKPALYQIIFSLIFATAPLYAMQPIQISDKIKVYCDETSSYYRPIQSYFPTEAKNMTIESELVPNEKPISREALETAYGKETVNSIENNQDAVAGRMFNSYIAPLRRKIENTHQACQAAKNAGISVHFGGAIGNNFYNDLIVAQKNATTEGSDKPALILESCVGFDKNDNSKVLAPYYPRYYGTNNYEITENEYEKLSKNTSLIIYKIQNIEKIADIIEERSIEANSGVNSHCFFMNEITKNISLANPVLDEFYVALKNDLNFLLHINVPVAIIVPEPVEQTKESEQIAEWVTTCILAFVNKKGPDTQQRFKKKTANTTSTSTATTV